MPLRRRLAGHFGRRFMRNSKHRFLTTHVGSLARTPELLKCLIAKERGEALDPQGVRATVRDAVEQVVHRQAELGVDVVCDGEQGKTSFLTYAAERLEGITQFAQEGATLWKQSRETLAFPEFYEANRRYRAGIVAQPKRLVCTGPLKYTGIAALEADIANVQAASAKQQVEEVFMTSISPSDIEGQIVNEFYATDEEFLGAIAEAMRSEYLAIVEAGLVLQIDDPRLLTYYISQPDLSVADCRRWAAARVEVLNYALRDIPPERVRFHTCYGINIGPRVHELNLKDIVDIMLTVNAGAYSFEAANPRHEHEWQVWKDVKLPAGKLIIPGVISHSTPLVEHPELVAQRLLRFASVVGKENVIGGSDCGFSSFANAEPEIHPTIVWEKFRSLSAGAKLATRMAW